MNVSESLQKQGFFHQMSFREKGVLTFLYLIAAQSKFSISISTLSELIGLRKQTLLKTIKSIEEHQGFKCISRVHGKINQYLLWSEKELKSKELGPSNPPNEIESIRDQIKLILNKLHKIESEKTC